MISSFEIPLVSPSPGPNTAPLAAAPSRSVLKVNQNNKCKQSAQGLVRGWGWGWGDSMVPSLKNFRAIKLFMPVDALMHCTFQTRKFTIRSKTKSNFKGNTFCSS